MLIRIIGTKRIIGNNIKTNRYRDGSIIHFAYHNDLFIGEAVDTAWVNESLFSNDNIKTGETYDAEILHGYLRSLKPVSQI